MDEFLKMISGKLYNSQEKNIIKLHDKGMYLCEKFNKISVKRKKQKQKALIKLIPSAKNKNLCVFAPFYCEYGKNIFVGNNCFINYNCVFLDVSPITLNDNVWIGPNVTFATPNHPLLVSERINCNYPDGYHDLEFSKEIKVDSGTWICANVLIIGGVKIGKNCVIKAGSVVTHDIPDNAIVSGMPAKVERFIDELDKINVWETYINESYPLSQRQKERSK